MEGRGRVKVSPTAEEMVMWLAAPSPGLAVEECGDLSAAAVPLIFRIGRRLGISDTASLLVAVFWLPLGEQPWKYADSTEVYLGYVYIYRN